LECGGLTPHSNKSKHREERNMGQRKSIDCRDYPSENNCSLKISGAEEEVLDAAVLHAISVHGHENTPELREQIKSMLKDEND
jgi:predicted small metal-binding protein